MAFFFDLFKTKLWIKVFLAFSILLLLFALSLTFLWNRQFVNTMQKERFSQFVQASQDANNHLEEQILSIEQLIDSIIINKPIIYDLKNLSTHESYYSAHEYFVMLRNTKYHELSGLLFISENGRILGIGSTYDDNYFKDILFMDKLKEIPDDMQNPPLYIQLNSEVFRLYTPVFSDNRYIGVIIADVNYKIINDTFVNQKSLTNTLSLLFDQDENLIFSTNYELASSISKDDTENLSKILDTIIYSNEFYPIECTALDCSYFGIAYRSSFTGLSNVILIPITDINNSYFKSTTFIISIISSLIFFFIALILSVLLGNNVIKRINKLKNHMICYTLMLEKIKLVNSDNIIVKDEIDECYLAYTEMLNHIKNQIDYIYSLNEQRRVLEINALESQLNPHFLYNTLNTIRYHAEKNNPIGVSTLCVALIDLLQFTLRNNKSFIRVKEEIAYIKNYITVNTFNSESLLNVQYHIPEEVLELIVPKMLLQPIIENCFKHGLLGTADDLIIIKATLSENELEFKVIDNGKGMEQKDLDELNSSLNSSNIPSNKIGLCNINKRLKILYGEKYGISVFSVQNMQTIITIRVPIIKEDKKI